MQKCEDCFYCEGVSSNSYIICSRCSDPGDVTKWHKIPNSQGSHRACFISALAFFDPIEDSCPSSFDSEDYVDPVKS